MTTSPQTAHCRACQARVDPLVTHCPRCGKRAPAASGGVDWGVVCLVLLLAAIGLLGWALWKAAARQEPGARALPARTAPVARPGPAEPASRPVEDSPDPEPPSEAELELRRVVADAERALMQVRLEAAQTGMTKIWQDEIEAVQLRYGEACDELAQLRARNRRR